MIRKYRTRPLVPVLDRNVRSKLPSEIAQIAARRAKAIQREIEQGLLEGHGQRRH